MSIKGFVVDGNTVKYDYESLDNLPDASDLGAVSTTDIAPTFSTSNAYAVGDYVFYSGTLYRFTSAHSAGAWNASHVTAVALGDDVDGLKTSFDSVTTESTSYSYDENDNLVSGLLTAGYYENSGNLQINNNFSYINVDVSGISKVKIGGTHATYTLAQFNKLGIFVNSGGTLVSSITAAYGSVPTDEPYEVTVPENATTMRLNTDYKASSYPSSLPSGLFVYPWRETNAVKLSNSALENEVPELSDISESGKKIKIVAGAIRNSGTGWAFINDTYHNPINLSTISVDSSGLLQIDYGFTAKKVLSLVVAPDETLSRYYSCGCSVGLSYSSAKIYALPITYGGLVTIANDAVTTTNSTFTSGTINSTTGEIRLYHPTVASLQAGEKFNISLSSPTNAVKLGSQGNDYVSLFVMDSNGDVIKTFGATTVTLYVNRDVNAHFVNAENVVSVDGNFWIYGVMEIE